MNLIDHIESHPDVTYAAAFQPVMLCVDGYEIPCASEELALEFIEWYQNYQNFTMKETITLVAGQDFEISPLRIHTNLSDILHQQNFVEKAKEFNKGKAK